MPDIVVTLDVSQLPISSLNMSYVEHGPPQPENKYDMSVTALVSHSEMCPYIASALVESLHHAPTAVRMVESVKL